MTFRYEIDAYNYCEAMEFLREHGCKHYTFSCPDHVFNFKAEFKDRIDDEDLEQYKSRDDFSVRMI